MATCRDARLPDINNSIKCIILFVQYTVGVFYHCIILKLFLSKIQFETFFQIYSSWIAGLECL